MTTGELGVASPTGGAATSPASVAREAQSCVVPASADRRQDPPSWWRRLSADQRVTLLICVMVSIAVALFVGVVIHLSGPVSPLHLPWPVWLAAFALGEACVVHVQARKESHSFSLNDLVLVAALCLAPPMALISAQVIGTGITLVVLRRQSGVKLAFNLAQVALGGVVATGVFAMLSHGIVWSSPWVWAAALAAIAAATLTGGVCVWPVLALSEGGRVSLRALRQLLELSLPFSVGLGAVGLLQARTAVLDPLALALLVPPCGLLIAAYRAYTHARQQQDNLRLLHEVTSLLYESGNAGDGLGNFLTAVREAFKAGMAEMVLLPEGTGSATVSRARENREAVTLLPLLETDESASLISSATAAGALVTRSGTGQSHWLDDYVARRGLKDAMTAVLRTEERVYGLLLVGSRLGEISTFSGSDLVLLETFARHVATSLERGRLQGDLRHLDQVQQKLRHQAMHDALTGLPNRTLFVDRTRTALRLANRTGAWPAVLYLDLDGFKPVNDRYGHEAGDVLLQTFAERLSGCLRAADTSARLGGDEFAVLVNGPIEAETVERVVERIRAQLARPIDVGGGRRVQVGASIGVALAEPSTAEVETLVRRADAAMYAAKRSGDGRHVLHGAAPDDGAADLA